MLSYKDLSKVRMTNGDEQLTYLRFPNLVFAMTSMLCKFAGRFREVAEVLGERRDGSYTT